MSEVAFVMLTNNIIMAFVTLVTTGIVELCKTVGNPYTYFITKIYNMIYGLPQEYNERTVTWNSTNPFPILGKIIEHIETTSKHRNNSYEYNYQVEKIMPSAITFGNINYGVTYSYVSSNGDNPAFSHSFVFHSRIHTRENFLALITDLKKQSYSRVEENQFIMKKPSRGNGQLNLKFFTRTHLETEKIHRRITNNIIKKIESKTARNFLLYGPPGTGKTTIISQIADHFNACVFVAKLSHFATSFEMYEYLLNTVYVGNDDRDTNISCYPKTKIFIFEDFNTMMPASFWGGRSESFIPPPPSSDEKTEKKESSSSYYSSKADLTYSELLNILDGVIPMNGVHTFWTTNHIEDINPSLIRNGRMHKEYVDFLEAEEVANILKISVDEVHKRYPNGVKICDIR